MAEPHVAAPEVDEGWAHALGCLVPGTMLGDAELLLPVARGGMGVVWASRRRDGKGSAEPVAVKTMLASLAADARYEKMFLTEARLASRIHHRNVCRVLSHGEERGILFLTMEWVDGEPLAALLAGPATVPYPIAAAIVAAAARGLHAAHEATGDDGAPIGLVHRDVSPRNLLVSESDGRVVVTDFGVAKATLRRGASTTGEVVKGTLRYLAPEQVYSEGVDCRADIFALGAVLYEATTGVAPFAAQTDLGVLAKIAGPEPARSPAFVEGYPPALAEVVERALQKDPAQRFATMQEFSEALEQAAAAFGFAGDDEVAALVRAKLGERLKARRAAIHRATVECRPPRLEPSQLRPRTVPRRTERAFLAAGALSCALGFVWWRGHASGEDEPRVIVARNTPPGEPAAEPVLLEGAPAAAAPSPSAEAPKAPPNPERQRSARPAARVHAGSPSQPAPRDPAQREPDLLGTRE